MKLIAKNVKIFPYNYTIKKEKWMFKMNKISSSVVVNKNKQIAITAALSALTILMGIPGLHLGYIQISPTVSLTIMHIPVVLAAVLAGLPGGIVTGLIFGLTSLVNAAANPSGVLDPFFVNPLCSVLPRLLFGLVSWGIFKLIELIPHCPKSVNSLVTAILSSLVHSFVVIGSLYLFLNGKISEAMNGLGYFALMLMILPGAFLEAVAAGFVCSIVVASITIVSNGKSKLLSKSDDE